MSEHLRPLASAHRSPATFAVILVVGVLAFLPLAANAQTPATVNLGTAGSFAVLAGQGVTNTGPTLVNGDLGTHPNPAVTGFPPGQVNGAIHAGDAVAQQAKNDLVTAYNDAAGRPCGANLSGQDLGGMTLLPGVYCFNSSAQLTGALTLNAQGNPDAVFIFQIGSALTTASASSVNFINGAQACNVFWQIGSSATLGTNSTFRGTILALTSIQAQTGANVVGRLLARNASVTLDDNDITLATCAAPQPQPSPSPSVSPTTSPGPTTSPTVSPGPTTPPPGGGGGGGGGGGDGGGGGAGGGGGGAGGGGGGGGFPPGVPPPSGAPGTGLGSTAGVEHVGLIVIGLLLAPLGLVVIRRRGARRGPSS